MKVKIFTNKEGYFKKTSATSLELEREINLWLEANPNIKIIKIKQNSSGGSLEPTVHLISLWYENND